MPVLSYPTPLATFFAGIRIASGDLRLTGAVQENATGGGEVITSAVGARLWEADATVVTMEDPGGVQTVRLAITEGEMFGAKVDARADARAVQVERSYDRNVVPQSRNRPSRDRG